MKRNLVAVLFRLIIGDSSDLEYEDGEEHHTEPPEHAREGSSEADWMEYDPHIQSILAQTNPQT
jgi:hypothetical protein